MDYFSIDFSINVQRQIFNHVYNKTFQKFSYLGIHDRKKKKNKEN